MRASVELVNSMMKDNKMVRASQTSINSAVSILQNMKDK